MESSIDLREEFYNIIAGWGHDIIYIRRILGLHCKCWNNKEQSGNPKCIKCFGTGFVVKVEIHKVRSKTNTMPISTSGLLQYDEQGTFMEPSYVFFMRYDSMPSSGDIILDVGWNNDNIGMINFSYEISFPEPERGIGGRIEFWKVACRLISKDTTVYYKGLTARNIRRNNDGR
jgi:hypothetical protein